MADYTQLMNLEKKQKSQTTPSSTQEKPSSQSIDQSTDRLTNQSTKQLTNQSIGLPTTHNGSRIMEKPRAFYITERLNQRLDEAVRYYQEKHNLKKVDRSVIVTALLDNEANWTEDALELLVDRVISQLTSRLTNR